MNEQSAAVGARKREQIRSTNKQVVIWAAVAAAALVIALMISINFIQRIAYGAKVNGAMSETNEILRNNVERNINQLKNNANALQSNQNLLALRLSETEPTDAQDTVFQVIIDALPLDGNPTELSASLQKNILRDFSIRSLSVDAGATLGGGETGEGSASTSISAPTPQPISFTVSVTGNYDSVQQLLQRLERSIRPITINDMTIGGSNSRLEVTINATTYYIPKVNYELGSKVIQQDGDN